MNKSYYDASNARRISAKRTTALAHIEWQNEKIKVWDGEYAMLGANYAAVEAKNSAPELELRKVTNLNIQHKTPPPKPIYRGPVMIIAMDGHCANLCPSDLSFSVLLNRRRELRTGKEQK